MTETDTDWPPARGTPESRLLAMMLGVAGTQLIGLAAHFGIADLLRDGPKPIGTLAEATGTREQALLQGMRALAALGIFAEPQPRQFVNIPLGDLLRSDDPNSLRGYAVLVSSAMILRAGPISHTPCKQTRVPSTMPSEWRSTLLCNRTRPMPPYSTQQCPRSPVRRPLLCGMLTTFRGSARWWTWAVGAA